MAVSRQPYGKGLPKNVLWHINASTREQNESSQEMIRSNLKQARSRDGTED